MDKELEKLLKELKESIGDFIKENKDKMIDKIYEAQKEECELSVKRDKNGESQVIIKGNTISLLVALAGLEKSVLEKTKVPSCVWEEIKENVKVEDGE